MQVVSTYEAPVAVNNEITQPTTLTTSEADLFKTTDQKFLHKSQLTLMVKLTLGSATQGTFYAYASPDGSTWYPICLYNTVTGEITQRKVVADSGSFSTGGGTILWFVDDIPLSACQAFKITGLSTGASSSTLVLNLFARDN